MRVSVMRIETKTWGILVLVLVATQLVGCGWYLRPRRPNCPPMAPMAALPNGGGGGMGDYGSGSGMPGGAGYGAGTDQGAFGSDGMGDKTRISGEPSMMLDTVYFDFDSSEIRGDQQAALERNLAWLRQNSGAQVRVEGHCDERGTEEYNLALGDRRADSIREWLIQRGIEPSRIQTVSKGELEPAVIGSDESAWSKNRRAEFLIIE